MKNTPMSAVAVLRMARSDTFTTEEPENISDSDISRRKKCLDSDNKTIHSGHFMISRVHLNEDEDEDEDDVVATLSPTDVKKEGFDFDNAKHEPSAEYQFGHHVSIDGSLTKLFQCMTLAYSGKLTSPKFKLFKGLKLMLKDKLRLNNIIWREWHMQFIKSRKPIVCQFSAPLDSDSHARAEAVVMEGKYWKRRLDTVTLEYKKWRVYFKENIKNMQDDVPTDELMPQMAAANQRILDQMPSRYAPQSPPMHFDEDFMMDFTDTLFSSLNQPFAFPNPREINYLANPDFIQPGLIQLQPNLDDFMDTSLDPLQEMITACSKNGNNIVTFTGQDAPPNMYDMTNPTAVLQDTLSSASEADLLGNAVDLADSMSIDQNIAAGLDMWGKNNTYTQNTSPVTYAAFPAAEPVGKVTLTPSVHVLMTQPVAAVTPVTIQHARPQRAGASGKEGQFAIPVGKPGRSKQRLIAPAPPPPAPTMPSVHSVGLPTVTQAATATRLAPAPAPPIINTGNKNTVSPGNSTLAQLLTSGGTYPLLKTEEPSATLSFLSSLSAPKPIQKKPANNKSNTLAKMLASSNTGHMTNQSTADTVASILGRVEPQTTISSVSTPNKMPTSPLNMSAFTSSPLSVPSPTTTRTRHNSEPASSDAFGFESYLDSPSMFDQSPESLASMEYKDVRPKHEDEREHYKEQRRALHISAEQKRRVNIKSGFDMLHTLIPSLQQNITTKISKAQMLQKTAEYCRKLKTERSSMQDEASLLKQEIETLKDAISNCQAQLPATGVPVTRQRADEMQEMFEDYIKNRTLQNWKFWIFSRIIHSLFSSYNNIVSTASIEDLCRSVLAWLDQHCSLVQLRLIYVDSMRDLSTTTSILSNPSRVREEAIAAVTKQERRDSI